MAFEGLSEKLSAAFKRLRNKGKLTDSDVKSAMREVRMALLEADVNYKVAKDFTAKVTERAVGADVMESLTPAQMVIKIVNEELTALMGSEETRINFANKQPTGQASAARCLRYLSSGGYRTAEGGRRSGGCACL